MIFAPSINAQQIDSADLNRIHTLAEAAHARLGAPALSIAVASGGRIIFRRGYGIADLENLATAKPETAYRTASLTKPVTATAVLQLVDEGKLALDSSIRAYVHALPAVYKDVTLRDLLRHTGGVRHYREGEFITARHCDRLADALAIFASDSLEHDPGEMITYSSYGYTLLGLAIETVTDMSYYEYVRERIFQPANMRATQPDDFHIIPNRAEGYVRDAEGALQNAPFLDSSCRMPAGGFVSTVEDLARFGIALESGTLLEPALLREMMRSHLTVEMISNTLDGIELPPGFRPLGMGFGWAIPAAENGAVYHGGNQPGATAMLYHLPGRRLTVVIMTNLSGLGDELTELAKSVLEAAVAGLAEQESEGVGGSRSNQW